MSLTLASTTEIPHVHEYYRISVRVSSCPHLIHENYVESMQMYIHIFEKSRISTFQASFG